MSTMYGYVQQTFDITRINIAQQYDQPKIMLTFSSVAQDV